MASTIETYLEADHRRLDGLLRAALADPARFDLEAFERFRAGLLRHIGLEEKLLIPRARKMRGEAWPLADLLRIEHSALASLLVPTPDHALAREIATLLQQHNRREEGAGGLYDECASLLGLDADVLVEQMRAVADPPLAKHFDGAGTHRTAADALRVAQRVRAS
jgi:hypothetical protein